jgi:hypothetical protein
MKYLTRAFADAKAIAAHLVAFLVTLVSSAQLFSDGHLTKDAYIQAGILAALSAVVHATQPDVTAAQTAADISSLQTLVSTFAPSVLPLLGKMPVAPAGTIVPTSPPSPAAPKPPEAPPLAGTPAL